MDSTAFYFLYMRRYMQIGRNRNLCLRKKTKTKKQKDKKKIKERKKEKEIVLVPFYTRYLTLYQFAQGMQKKQEFRIVYL